MEKYILSMKEIQKSFGVPVLKKVDFDLKKGEIHALIGSNGAGKSTLMKIMTGVYSKDSGRILVNGEEKNITNTHDARKYGIGMIFQELSLVHTMTVAENIFLGDEIVSKGLRNTSEMNKKARDVLEELGIDIDPNAKLGDLSVGMTQMVEIAKAMSKNAKILVFDEPTASLTNAETKQLFEMIGGLKKKGVSMVYISHRMNEIMEIADSLTILRDGIVVHQGSIKDIDLDSIINSMIGETRTKRFEWKPRDYKKSEEIILSVEKMRINEKIDDISFTLRKGEILGFAGLMGSGRTEILEALFGLRPIQSGTITVKEKRLLIKNSGDAIREGIALVPEDRRKQGLVLTHSVKENAILPKVSKLRKQGVFVDEKQANSMVDKNISQLGIVTDSIHKRINLLSGGNQQKVVIGKWLNMNPEVLMLDESTAGVDVGAKAEIIDLVRNFADTHKGVILVSSELAELMAVCDRIITLYDGKITGEILRENLETEEELQRAIQKKHPMG